MFVKVHVGGRLDHMKVVKEKVGALVCEKGLGVGGRDRKKKGVG